eukprot:678931-Hanusia_phi.AAC.1
MKDPLPQVGFFQKCHSESLASGDAGQESQGNRDFECSCVTVVRFPQIKQKKARLKFTSTSLSPSPSSISSPTKAAQPCHSKPTDTHGYSRILTDTLPGPGPRPGPEPRRALPVQTVENRRLADNMRIFI